MIVVRTVYVKRLPPKNAIVRLTPAISSCSPEEIKKPNPKPDLHYFEMYWYSPAVGGVQKNILRLLYPTYKMASEEYDIMHNKLFGNTKDWIDDWYEPQFKEMQKEIMISRENRRILEEWKAKYEQGSKYV